MRGPLDGAHRQGLRARRKGHAAARRVAATKSMPTRAPFRKWQRYAIFVEPFLKLVPARRASYAASRKVEATVNTLHSSRNSQPKS